MALWPLGVGLAAIVLLTMTSDPVQGSPGYVVCYYSSWAHYRQGLAKYTVDDIPVDLCTHLIYAFATMDSKTYLAKPFDRWLDIDLKNYEKFVQLKKKNPKMKVLLGVGGWNDSRSTKYSTMVADSTKRRKFVEEVVKLLLEFGFDGLDLDWEYPGYESKREDKEGFTRWVEDLKTALTPHSLLLTTAVSASRRVIDRGYDIPKIIKHLDFVNLMAYDFHGSWERVVAHHSPLYPESGQNPEFNADFAVNYWIKKGAPAHKIVLGVPLYGRSWTLSGSANDPGSGARGAGKPGKYVKERGHLAYFECCLAHQKDGWAKVTGEGGPYLTKDDQWVGYDDIEAVTKKAEYARNKGLGGIMVWDTVSDDFTNACGHGENPLLTAIFKTLQGSPSSTSQASNRPTTPPGSPSTRPGSRPNIWSRAHGSKQPGGGSNFIRGSSGVKTSPIGGGGGSSQSTKLPYDWLAWPLFSQSPQGSQNNVPGTSSIVTPSSVSTSNRIKPSSTHSGGSANKNSNGQTPYHWQSWPVFNQSPQGNRNTVAGTPRVTPPSVSSSTRIKFPSTDSRGSAIKHSNGQTPYHWQSWPIFNKSPQSNQNTISSSSGSGPVNSVTPSTLSSTTFRFPTTSRRPGSSPSQTTNAPYSWLSWPIFNKPTQGNQNTISSSASGPVSPVTPSTSSFTSSQLSTTSRFSLQNQGSSNKGSNGLGSSSTQTTKPPYSWESWPIFNKPSEDRQNTIPPSSVSGSFSSATPSTLSSTSSRFSTTSRITSQSQGNINQDSNVLGSGSSQTTKSPYDWLSWPLFNKPQGNQNSIPASSSIVTTPSPPSSSTRLRPTTTSFSFQTQRIETKGSNTLGSGSSQSTEPPYEWLAWPIFNRPSGSADNSISSFSSRTGSSFSTSTTPSPSSPSNLPSSLRSKFSSSSSAFSWFVDCKAVGYAPDPASCSAFYRCTEKYAYRFDCPGGLLWHQGESSCDWPDVVQCVLPLSKPSIEEFRPPEPLFS